MRNLKANTADFAAESRGNDSDMVAAYLDLALKIYLRLKSEGQSIHKLQFDDDADLLYDHPGAGRPDLPEIQ